MISTGGSTLGVFLAFACMIALAGSTLIYNSFARLKQNIDRAWSNIDVLLRQRHDEIPGLVNVVNAYAEHERDTIKQVIEARTQYDDAHSFEDLAKASENTSAGLKTLFVVAENYPELKSDQHFRDIRKRITDLEDHIADRREFYNHTVSVYNRRLSQLPDLLIARMLKLSKEPHFDIKG